MEKILVTQALNELKTLDDRITRAISKASFVTTAKTVEKKVTPAKSKEDFIEEAKSSFDSITALIKRRELIKAAVVQSNAITEVDICGQKMSVAKAIDLKSSMMYEKNWLNIMQSQLNRSVSEMNRKNSDMENRLENLITQNFAKESKTSIKPDDYEAIAKPYREANEYSLVDPLNIEKLIEDKQKYIEEFEATVDQILQISNCTTFIEI